MTTLPDKIVRDPLWETIRLDATAVRIIDTPEFQRLRYIRQLGFTHLVYPGATHTRFDHALGVYHLTTTALSRLRERGGVPPEVWEGEELVPYAALLHDIGHYAFSHALEELEPDSVPIHHEDVAERFFASSALRDALAPLGLTAPDRIHELIRGRSDVPLRGLVSGSLDLDKMEYLRRDARFCGVPYGEVDVSRLLEGLQLLEDPATERFEVGVHEKAVAALRSSIRSVVLPSANEADLEQLPQEVLENVSFVMVRTMDEVMEAALVTSPLRPRGPPPAPTHLGAPLSHG